MINHNNLEPLEGGYIKKVLWGIFSFSVIILFLFLVEGLVFHDEVPIPNPSKIVVEGQGEGLEESDLTQEEIDELILNDPSRISISEAEELILKYSKSLTKPEQVKSFFRQMVLVRCDIEGELSEGSGFLVRDDDVDSTIWNVYTNAHITNVDPAKVRMCMVSVPRVAGADVSDNEAVDRYETAMVKVARNYPDVDFTELKIIDPGKLPDASLRKCLPGENSFLDRVLVLGYPSGLTVTSGAIMSFPEEGIVETSAKAYPGNSGGLGFNLSKDCTIGIVAWSEEETYSAWIQTWEMLGI